MHSMLVQTDRPVNRLRWFLAALLMALYLVAAVRANGDGDIPIPLSVLCQSLEPYSVDWWIAGCWMF